MASGSPPPLALDVAGVVGVVAQLPAKTCYRLSQGPYVSQVPGIPDSAQQRVMGQHPSCVGRELLEQAVFDGGQPHCLAGDGYPAFGVVDAQVPAGVMVLRVRGPLPVAPEQGCAYPGDQLNGGVGLEDVVGRSPFQGRGYAWSCRYADRKMTGTSSISKMCLISSIPSVSGNITSSSASWGLSVSMSSRSSFGSPERTAE